MGSRMTRLHPELDKHSGKRVRGGKHVRKKGRYLVAALAVVLLALLMWPFLEARSLTVTELTVKVENLPDNMNNLRIAYVTDIHAYTGPYGSQASVDGMIHRVNTLNADLVLLGGDYSTDTEGAIRFFRSSQAFTANQAVAGVIGETDLENDSRLAELQSAMLGAGVVPLINNVEAVRIGSGTLYIAGLDDCNAGTPDIAAVSSRLKESDTVILLSHSPEILPQVYSTRDKEGGVHWFDLVLCGHTHGGKARFVTLSLTSPLKTAQKYMSGVFTDNRATEIVSRGVGMTGLPVRVMCRPEIYLITLTK